METKFTPGPWKIDFGHPRGLPGGVSQEGGKPVTRFGVFAKPTTPEALANARLIAAAPELYEVIVGLNRELDAFWHGQSQRRTGQAH